jgi:two-component system copper resistance phosphate regulon response regulator CusR
LLIEISSHIIAERRLPLATASVRHRVLIVEDEAKMARSLSEGISAQGFEVRTAATGEEGFFLVYDFRPHVILLDLNLPGRGGLDILRQIREQALDVRVLVLTSHNEVEERVQGLRAGADDYLGKPFAFTELLARIEALLRREHPEKAARTLSVADLTLDMDARRARRFETDLALTQKEFDLLLYLVENRNRTVSREMLARDVWRENARFTPIDNVIDVQMARLRRKVDDPFESKLLHTVRGVGFVLREPPL